MIKKLYACSIYSAVSCEGACLMTRMVSIARVSMQVELTVKQHTVSKEYLSLALW